MSTKGFCNEVMSTLEVVQPIEIHSHPPVQHYIHGKPFSLRGTRNHWNWVRTLKPPKWVCLVLGVAKVGRFGSGGGGRPDFGQRGWRRVAAPAAAQQQPPWAALGRPKVPDRTKGEPASGGLRWSGR